MRQGTVIKAYSGFYYVETDEGVWECRLRGKFKLTKQTVLAGDRVMVAETQYQTAGPKGGRADGGQSEGGGRAGSGRAKAGEVKRAGVIEEILPRTSVLERPAVANVDQVVIVFACKEPDPQTELLDRILIMAEAAGLQAVICFNKADLVDPAAVETLLADYRGAGYDVLATSAVRGDGIEALARKLKERITVFAGPSGSGKSSLLNAVYPGFRLKTGAVSEKIGRGRHTTRYAELLEPAPGTWVVDSPGFSSLFVPDMDKQHLAEMFPEFLVHLDRCRFNGCLHRSEPDCRVKEAVEAGQIGRNRYDHYLMFLDELSGRERRY